MATRAKKNTDVAGTVKPAGTAAVAASASNEAGHKTIKRFQLDGTHGSVSVGVFVNTRMVQGKLTTFYNVSFNRRYQTRTGEWRGTKSFDKEDLGRLAYLSGQAAEWIEQQEQPRPQGTSTPSTEQ